MHQIASINTWKRETKFRNVFTGKFEGKQNKRYFAAVVVDRGQLGVKFN